MPTCDRCEIGERQSGYCSVTFSAFSQFTDSVLLHRWVHLSRRDITVSRNSLTRYTAWHLRIRRLVQFIFVGAIYHNALTICAALLCRALRRVNRLCSRTVSGTANRLRKTRKKKSSAVPLFRSGRRSPIFVGLSSKGKVGVQRGRKTAGCPSFLLPAAGAATFPPQRRRIPR